MNHSFFKIENLMIVAFMATALFLSPVAQAGFEWTPRENNTYPKPWVNEDKSSVKPTPVNAAPPLIGVKREMLNEYKTKSMPIDQAFDNALNDAISKMKTDRPASSSYKVVEGFGNDIPLVLALRMIVPAHYGYSFEPGVDNGLSVSWQGGKPWDIILENTLNPHGLKAEIHTKSIKILTVEKAPLIPEKTVTALPMVPFLPSPPPAQIPSQTRYGRIDNNAHLNNYGYNDPAIAPQARGIPFSMENRATRMPQNPIGIVQPIPTTPPIYKNDLSLTGAYKSLSVTPDINFWQATSGQDLKHVLLEWSKEAGVELLWNIEIDYAMPTNFQTHGTFTDAVSEVLQHINSNNVRAEYYTNAPQGPPVLVVNG